MSNARAAEREVANLRLCVLHPYIVHMREVKSWTCKHDALKHAPWEQRFPRQAALSLLQFDACKSQTRQISEEGQLPGAASVLPIDCQTSAESLQWLQVFLTRSHLALVFDYAPGGNLANYIETYQSSKLGRGISEVSSSASNACVDAEDRLCKNCLTSKCTCRSGQGGSFVRLW